VALQCDQLLFQLVVKMNNWYLLILSFAVGVMVVMQGALNARLGVLLNNSLLATSSALVISASFTVLVVLITVKQFPTMEIVRTVPRYMWISGGLLSFTAVRLFFYVIPKAGISTAITFGLLGQIIFAAIAGHYGWFGMPVEPISIKKIIGMGIMVTGVLLIKF